MGLRFGVARTGCSGWGYKVDMARSMAPGDTVFDADGVGVYVDADSLSLVDGTQIDFIKQGLNEQFVFRNPNVAGECGCGESFTTDADKGRLSRPARRICAQVLESAILCGSRSRELLPERAGRPERDAVAEGFGRHPAARYPQGNDTCVITKSCSWSTRTRASRCRR